MAAMISYNGLEIVDVPTGGGGIALNNNFKNVLPLSNGTLTATNGAPINIVFSSNSTSGLIVGAMIGITYNQASGTAANTDLLVNRTETHVGSGAQLLLDLQVGGTSRFKVSNGGTVTASGLVIASGFQGNGASLSSLNAGSLTAGTVPVARLGTNSPSSALFLRGDNTWQSVVTSPAGSSGQIQFNNSGSFAGDPNLVWSASGPKLSINAGTNFIAGEDSSYWNSNALNQSGFALVGGTTNLPKGLATGPGGNVIALHLNDNHFTSRNSGYPGASCYLDGRGTYGRFHIYTYDHDGTEHAPFNVREDNNVEIDAGLLVNGTTSTTATISVNYPAYTGPAISLTGNDEYGTSIDFINTYSSQNWGLQAGRSDGYYGMPEGSFAFINESLNSIAMFIDPSDNVTMVGNVTIRGSLTYSSSDPELETFYPIPLSRAVELLRKNTPMSKWGGISFFFNKDRNQFEAIDHQSAKVFKVNMTEIEQLSDVSPLPASSASATAAGTSASGAGAASAMPGNQTSSQASRARASVGGK